MVQGCFHLDHLLSLALCSPLRLSIWRGKLWQQGSDRTVAVGRNGRPWPQRGLTRRCASQRKTERGCNEGCVGGKGRSTRTTRTGVNPPQYILSLLVKSCSRRN